MKIVYLAAGAADMYCGSCIHDNTLAAAMLKDGQDVLLVPTYTPIRTDEKSVSQERVFFGGINVYLQQKLPLFRHTPWFVDRLLDHPGLIRWLSKGSGSTDPAKLGPMTVSILRGEEGNQRKEVAKLIRWLADEVHPEVLHLSNAMLLGMTHDIRRELSMPIVCSLSGEDIFLDKLVQPYRDQARDELRKRAEHVAKFVALNGYYADRMADYLDVERSRIEVIAHGLNLEGFARRASSRADGDETVTIGYLARICEDKGLHQLVEAFGLLSQRTDLPPLRLRAAGYLGKGDHGYFRDVQQRAAKLGIADRFEYAGELDRAEKIAFYQSLDIMSVPTVYRESKGLTPLEAMACGVPVVLPEHGSFPELVGGTGGGILHDPECGEHLAEALARLVLDREGRETLGQRGFEAIHRDFTSSAMSANTIRLYEQVAGGEVDCDRVDSDSAAGGARGNNVASEREEAAADSRN